MQKSYKLEGLDCASCADKIEKSVQKINEEEKRVWTSWLKK